MMQAGWGRWLPWAILAAAVLAWGWFDVARRAHLDPDKPYRHRTDLTVFTTAGQAFFDGRDPYTVKNPRGWQYNYPPLLALAMSPLAMLPHRIAGFVWFCLNLALALGCIVESLRLIRLVRCNIPDHVVTWLSIAAAGAVTLPTFNALQRGQIGLVLLYPMLLGLRMILQRGGARGGVIGGAVLSLAAVIKVFPALPALFIAVIRTIAPGRDGRRAGAGLWLGGTLGAILFLLIIPAAIVGWNSNIQHLKRWSSGVVLNEQLAEETGFNIHTERNQSFSNSLFLLSARLRGYTEIDPGPHPAKALEEHPAYEALVAAIRVGFVALLLMVGLALAGRGDALGLAAGFGMACLLTLMVSPLAWVHYYLIQFPALLFVPMWLWREGRQRSALVAAVLPVVLVVGHYAWVHGIGDFGVLGLGTAGWFVGSSCVILKTCWQQRISERYGSNADVSLAGGATA
jgi:hypothetical protein